MDGPANQFLGGTVKHRKGGRRDLQVASFAVEHEEHDPEDRTYRLPAEYAAWLTHAASPNNVAVTAQFVPLMGSVEDGIVEKFRNGGGLPYSAYPRFHEVMAEDSAQTTVAALRDHILPLALGLTERLEAGID
ncbi:MAG: hypothetical protein M3324_00095, partial [Actinomycetota bacterium]|nr:hypothetical protein [Actinomycetota bacterium]